LTQRKKKLFLMTHRNFNISARLKKKNWRGNFFGKICIHKKNIINILGFQVLGVMVTVDPATTQKTVTAILLVLPTVIAVITTKSYAPTPVILALPQFCELE